MPTADRTLVSCLMVTAARPERFRLVERSIRDFCAQSHSPKELVIVCDGPIECRRRLRRHVRALGAANIRLVLLEGTRTLGALRNVSLDHARGGVLCQWDDDDVQHPDRLKVQLGALLESRAGATLLQNCLHLFTITGDCYWVNWGKTRYGGHPGTVMFLKHQSVRYPERGPYARAGEDSVFWGHLNATVKTAFVVGPPYLYVYQFHGRNTFQAEHHLMLARRFSESRRTMLQHAGQLLGAMEDLGIGEAGTCLMDSKGPVLLC